MTTDEFRNRSNSPREVREARQVQLPRSAKEFFEETVFDRANRASPKLRPQLLGKIILNFTDTGKKYLFDWSTDSLKSELADSNVISAAGNIDCSIKLSEKEFMRIVQGDLNPQVALLSEKINIEGQSGLAIYFFNLVAPA